MLKEKQDDSKALEEEAKDLQELFRKAVSNDKLTVKAENLKDTTVAAIITLSEESRRMSDMMKMYGMSGNDDMFKPEATLVLNAKHPLVAYIYSHKDAENISLYCEQVYDLAMLSNQPLSPEEMTKFVQRSNDILLKNAQAGEEK